MTHTPGPWYADKYGKIWRNVPSDLYEYGGKIAGDMPLAFVSKGWYEEDETPYPQQANAHLIAAAPDMLEALGIVLSLMDESSGVVGYHLNGEVATWEELGIREEVEAAIKKARGEE